MNKAPQGKRGKGRREGGVRLNTTLVTDSEEYREVKVKRTWRGVKENLKRCAYKPREHFSV